MTTEEMFSLYDAIYEISGGTPGLGREYSGAKTGFERYDPIAIATVHAGSFRDAFGIGWPVTKRLTCPGSRSRIALFPAGLPSPPAKQISIKVGWLVVSAAANM